MQAIAIHKNAGFSAQKGRLLADLIRGLRVEEALNILTYNRKKAATNFKKTLESAVANAEHNLQMDIDELWVSTVYVNEGVTMKRWQARAKGRGNRILKRSCHITVIVSDKDPRK